jgi:alginate O-acetyltransferase complex protein AlgI
MVFSSPIFLLVFLPVFSGAYFLTPTIPLKNLVIVLFSIFFFAWGDPVFIWYVIIGVAIDYLIITQVLTHPSRSQIAKKIALASAILINVFALLFFKYANFFVDQFQPILTWFGVPKPSWYGIALPLGISFIAFHKISFVIDLYKGRADPPRSFVNALLYILFFPQLIAGPIIRYHEIHQQITTRSYDTHDFLIGFFRFARGLAKKVLIADPAGRIAGIVFETAPESLPIHYAWVGVLAYTVQIYFDFSGYSDMAIGLGRICGFRFPENFNQPYTAHSVTEFWRRWHITLSNWMRLYLYIPLGGNHVPPWRMYLNLWIVFLISGFWHGAAWTFIVWGAYYGFFLTVEKFYELRGWRLPLPGPMKQFLTFLIVLTAWVPFRSTSMDYAARLWGRMYGLLGPLQGTPEPFYLLFQSSDIAAAAMGLMIAIVPLPAAIRRLAVIDNSMLLDTVRWSTSILFLLLSISGIIASGTSPFLYFRF